MKTNDDILKILKNSLIETVAGRKNILFIDESGGVDAGDFFDHLTALAATMRLSISPCRYTADEHPEAHPYYPFLQLVRNRLQSLNRDDIARKLEKIPLYHFHRDIFCDYFSGLTINRNESIIVEEIDYETRRFGDDLAHLLTETDDGRIQVIVIQNLRGVSPTTANFIRRLLSDEFTNPMLLIVGMNITDILSSQETGDYLKTLLIDIVASQTILNPKPDNNIDSGKTVEAKRPPASPSQLIDLMHFLCIEETIQAGNKLYNTALSSTDASDTELLLFTLDILTQAYYCNREIDTALIYNNQFINIARTSNNPQAIATSLRSASILYYAKSDSESAIRLAYQAWQMARASGNHRESALAAFALYLGKDSTNILSDSDPELQLNLFDSLSADLRNLKFYNHLAYICTRTLNLVYFSRAHGSDRALDICRQGLDLAEQYGNQFRLSHAYHALGLLYQNIGDTINADDCYRKSESAKELHGTNIEKARICNGIGYFQFSQENYADSITYYMKALSLLEKSKQYQEICTTLINIGITYLFSFHYDRCIHYLEEALRIMNYLDITDLPFHPRFNIYSILGIAYFKEKHSSKAYELIGRIEGNPSTSRPLHRAEYYFFLLAEREWFEGNTDAAADFFEKAISALSVAADETRHIILFCYFEYGHMYFENDLIKKAAAAFRRGLNAIPTENTYPFHRALLLNALNRGDFPDPAELEYRKFESGIIFDLIKQDITLNRLHRKIQEINFLNSLQNIIYTRLDTRETIIEAGRLIQNSFLTEFCIIALAGDEGTRPVMPSADKFNILFSSPEISPEQRSFLFDTVLPQFTTKETLLVDNEADNRHTPLGNLYAVAYLPLSSDDRLFGFIFCVSGNREFRLSQDDMRTLALAANQITISIELKNATARLLQAAIVDGLTGVLNRQETINRMESERKRLFRYSKGLQSNFSVLFLDLDNFKHFNDTYGHHTGDLILRYFVGILERSTRSVDVIGRWGGDEFVIMLPETPKTAAVTVAERVIRAVSDQTALSHYLMEQAHLNIGPEERLGCSIGISEFHPASGSEVEHILQNADSALYESKRTGKNRYTVH